MTLGWGGTLKEYTLQRGLFQGLQNQRPRHKLNVMFDAPSNCLKGNVINAFWSFYAWSLPFKRGGEALLWEKKRTNVKQ